jgi:hypothetical protein
MSRINDRSTAVLLPAAQQEDFVNLLDRAPTAMALIAIAIASKLFDTAARKHTIGVDTMSQVPECGRSLSLAGAEEEGRSRSLELSVNQVARGTDWCKI